MLPGINPRQMKQAMKRMGMQQEDLDVKEVIFRMGDRDLVISNPTVSKVNMMGQESFQVVGDIEERSIDTIPEMSDEDIQMVMDQANCSKKEALEALETSKGDLAEAIMALSQ